MIKYINICIVITCLFFLGSARLRASDVISDCDIREDWEYGEFVTDLKEEGKASLKWSHGVNRSVILRKTLNLGGVEGISFWMHSNVANGQRFSLVMSSENLATEKDDYFRKTFVADFIGWKYFELRKSDFVRAHEPRFDKITSIAFHSSGWANTPNSANVIHIDDIRKLPVSEITDCDTRGDWIDGVIATDVKQEGSAALKWEHRIDAVITHKQALDLSGVSGISFWMHSNVANGQRFNLILSADDKSTEKSDYFRKTFIADFVGWRYFEIRKSEFLKARSPRFSDISDMFFTAKGWGETPNSENVVHVDHFQKLAIGNISSGDDLNEWNGGKIVKTPLKEGEGALLWDQGEFDEVSVTVPPVDMTKHKFVSFWIHSNVANGQPVKVILSSENGETASSDYYVNSLSLDFTGWKRFNLPLSGFKVIGKPQGLDRISEVSFTSSVERGMNPNPVNQIIIDQVELTEPKPKYRFTALLPRARPRLYVADWNAEQARISESEDLKKIKNEVIARAKDYLSEPVVSYAINGGRLLSVSRILSKRVQDLSYAYRVTGDKIYLNKAIAEMESAARFPSWNPNHFLDVGEMVFGMAVGYDWLRDSMTQKQRDVILDAIITKGLQTYIENKKRWWRYTNSNWSGVCNGGMGVAALAVLDTHGILANEVLELVFDGLEAPKGYMEEYGPDGAWVESPSYWSYGTSYLVYFMAALESLFKTSYGLADYPGLSRTGRFPIDMLSSRGSHVFNFGDGHSSLVQNACLFWLGTRYGDPLLSWYQQRYHKNSVFDLIWYNGSGQSPNALGVRLDGYYRNAEIASFRTSWNDYFGTSLMFKAGDNDVGHSQLDVGEFILESRGVRWIADRGNESYGNGYVGGEAEALNGTRWTFYRARAEANNTIVINPRRLLPLGYTGDQNPKAKTVIEKFRTNNAGVGFAVADLTDAYAPYGALSVKRGVAMVNNRQQILVQDEVRLDGPSSYTHFLTLGVNKSEVQLNGSVATLSRGGEKLDCQILEPVGAAFKLVAGVQAPGLPRSASQAENNFPRLAIQLDGVKLATVRVLFTPRPGGRRVSLPQPARLLLGDPRWPEGKSKSYKEWAVATFGVDPRLSKSATAGADFDQNGVTNLSEYAYGESDDVAGLISTKLIEDDKGNKKMAFALSIRPEAQVEWALESSKTLVGDSWVSIPYDWVVDKNDPSRVTVTCDVEKNDEKCFYRIRVSLP